MQMHTHDYMYLGTWKLQNFPMCSCSLSSSHLQSRHKRSKRILHLSPTAGPVPGWDGPPHWLTEWARLTVMMYFDIKTNLEE